MFLVYGRYVRNINFCLHEINTSLRLTGPYSKSLSTSALRLKINEFSRQAYFLNKLMTGQRKKWPAFNSDIDKSSQSFKYDYAKNKVFGKRKSVFNSLLMRYISDLLATGEISHQFLGKGIEITGVRVNQDLSRADVFWYSTKKEYKDIIGPLLNEHAGFLRSELCHLHLLGEIPFLIFYKDARLDRAMVVEELLAKADFGPDPSELTTKSEGYVESVNGPNQISVEATKTTSETESKVSSNKLKTNVYGLDRESMLKKIEEKRRVSKSNSQIVARNEKHDRNNLVGIQLDNKSSIEKMADYIKKQKREKMKLRNWSVEKPIDDDSVKNYKLFYEEEPVEEEDKEYNIEEEYDTRWNQEK